MQLISFGSIHNHVGEWLASFVRNDRYNRCSCCRPGTRDVTDYNVYDMVPGRLIILIGPSLHRASYYLLAELTRQSMAGLRITVTVRPSNVANQVVDSVVRLGGEELLLTAIDQNDWSPFKDRSA